MEVEIKFKIKISEDKIFELTENEAKLLYNTLHEKFEKENSYPYPYHDPYPYQDPYQYPYLITTTCDTDNKKINDISQLEEYDIKPNRSKKVDWSYYGGYINNNIK